MCVRASVCWKVVYCLELFKHCSYLKYFLKKIVTMFCIPVFLFLVCFKAQVRTDIYVFSFDVVTFACQATQPLNLCCYYFYGILYLGSWAKVWGVGGGGVCLVHSA